MSELTEKESMLVLDIVADAKTLTNEELLSRLKTFGANAEPHLLTAINNELSKVPKFKSIYEKWNKLEDDDTTLITVQAPSGQKNKFANSEEYKIAKDNFNIALSEYNMVAMEMQTLQDDYDSLKTRWFENEDLINYHASVLKAESNIKSDRRFFQRSKSDKEIKSMLMDKYPDLFEEMKDLKGQLKEVRLDLGGVTRDLGDDSARQIPYNRKDAREAEMHMRITNYHGGTLNKEEFMSPIIKFRKARKKLGDMLNLLNVYEEDGFKTNIPMPHGAGHFLMSYYTATRGAEKARNQGYDPTTIFNIIKIEDE